MIIIISSIGLAIAFYYSLIFVAVLNTENNKDEVGYNLVKSVNYSLKGMWFAMLIQLSLISKYKAYRDLEDYPLLVTLFSVFDFSSYYLFACTIKNAPYIVTSYNHDLLVKVFISSLPVYNKEE